MINWLFRCVFDIKQLSTQGCVFTTVVTQMHNVAYCFILNRHHQRWKCFVPKYIRFQRNDLILNKHVHVIHVQIIQIRKLAALWLVARLASSKLALTYVKALTFALALLCTCWPVYVKPVKRTSSPLRAFHPRASAVRDCAGVRRLPLYR